MAEPHNLHMLTVGEIRAALDGCRDDELVLCQTVAADGGAWFMCGSIGRTSGGELVLSLKHRDLITLPKCTK